MAEKPAFAESSAKRKLEKNEPAEDAPIKRKIEEYVTEEGEIEEYATEEGEIADESFQQQDEELTSDEESDTRSRSSSEISDPNFAEKFFVKTMAEHHDTAKKFYNVSPQSQEDTNAGLSLQAIQGAIDKQNQRNQNNISDNNTTLKASYASALTNQDPAARAASRVIRRQNREKRVFTLYNIKPRDITTDQIIADLSKNFGMEPRLFLLGVHKDTRPTRRGQIHLYFKKDEAIKYIEENGLQIGETKIKPRKHVKRGYLPNVPIWTLEEDLKEALQFLGELKYLHPRKRKDGILIGGWTFGIVTFNDAILPDDITLDVTPYDIIHDDRLYYCKACDQHLKKHRCQPRREENNDKTAVNNETERKNEEPEMMTPDVSTAETNETPTTADEQKDTGSTPQDKHMDSETYETATAETTDERDNETDETMSEPGTTTQNQESNNINTTDQNTVGETTRRDKRKPPPPKKTKKKRKKTKDKQKNPT